MNILKNMEAIFLAAAVLTGIGCYATAAAADVTAAAPARHSVQAAAAVQPMAVVHVHAKRLSRHAQ